jgi:outer membrane protein OmpA-like peptidoglycan-associated protein/tetratricopeptide (TPR) repeat protein
MKPFFSLLIILLACQLAWSQTKYSTNSRNAIKSYETASYLLDLNNFDEAKTELLNAIKQDDEFIEAYLLLADVYRVTFDNVKAKEYYKAAFKVNPNFAPDRYYYFAESELKTGDYEAALLHYTLYREKGKPNLERIELTEKYINDCKFAIAAVKNPVAFKPQNLGPSINSADQEYHAALTVDEVSFLFTRQINSKENMYKSVKIDTGYSEATFLSEKINTPEFNEGAQCISPDGQFLFFTGCTRPDGLGRCDIYIAQKEGDGWSNPINLGFPINTKGWESQPSLSADGKTLYFISDRRGGYGSYDIWKSNIQTDGTWSMPENLGPKINTKYDEQSPFIHPDDQTLYFSSNGWPGLGQKDIFISRLDSIKQWSLPLNLGYPINTYGEETGLTINASGTKAFFSSNNFKGYGGFDIYSFDLPQKLRPNPVNYVSGVVFDEDDKQKLSAVVDIIDIKTSKSIHIGLSDAIDGTFLASLPNNREYSLNVSKKGYLFYSENFSVQKNIVGKPIILDVPLQKIAVGKKVVLKNIFFDTNKFNLKQESVAELAKMIEFLQENTKVEIELSGHTDNLGDTNYNVNLSQNRAKAVFDYLINNGIEAKRLSFKGYGKSLPVADNSTEEGRANNRRTEFLIKKIAE